MLPGKIHATQPATQPGWSFCLDWFWKDTAAEAGTEVYGDELGDGGKENN